MKNIFQLTKTKIASLFRGAAEPKLLAAAAAAASPQEVEPYCTYRSRRWFAPRQHRAALDSAGKRIAPMRKVATASGYVYEPYGPVRATFVGDRSRYKPHQGAKECARRLRQARVSG